MRLPNGTLRGGRYGRRLRRTGLCMHRGDAAAVGYRSHGLAEVSDAEVLTVASKHFRGNQEVALSVMRGVGYPRRAGYTPLQSAYSCAGGVSGASCDQPGRVVSHRPLLHRGQPARTCLQAGQGQAVSPGVRVLWLLRGKRENSFGWQLHLICTPVCARELRPGGGGTPRPHRHS